MIQDAVMPKVEERPEKIGEENSLCPSLDEGAIGKRFMYVHVVEDAEGGDEKEYGDRKSGDNLVDCCQIGMGGRTSQILGADVDAYNAEHGDAADVFNCREPGLRHAYTAVRKNFTFDYSENFSFCL